jgi:hypothetical protein
MISYLIPCGDAGLKERVPSEVNEKKWVRSRLLEYNCRTRVVTTMENPWF